MFGIGFGMLAVSLTMFYAIRPDKNPTTKWSWPLFWLMLSGAGLMLASVVTVLYRALP